VRVSSHAPCYETTGPQGGLQAAHDRKAARAPPAGHFIVPIAFTTGGSFYKEPLSQAMTQWRALHLAEAEAEGDDREHERGARLVCLRWLPRLSAAAVRGTALLLSRLLRAARGPEQLLMSDVVGTAADTRMRLTGTTGASW